VSTPTIELICFPGAPNLPIFVAREKGFFEQAGVAINLTTTPSSAYQAETLVSRRYHIGGTAFDNVVAYQEGQGAAKLTREPDLFAFMGATQIELAFVVAPEITSYQDLKGKMLALDALSTGFAFVLYEMLARGGLKRGDYQLAAVGATPQRWESVRSGYQVGTITIEPFTSIAKSQGFKVLDTSTNIFSAYQGGSFAASRQWAAANPDSLKGFIKGYLAGLAWTLAPENRQAATDTLLRNMPEVKVPMADAVMDSLLSPRSGLTPYAAMLPDGVRTVLDLRTRYGKGKLPLTKPMKYIDPRYYDEARKS
jgi:ABC-type nitrate/sulfonate/bicarbonate transport system substrate-binding protein